MDLSDQYKYQDRKDERQPPSQRAPASPHPQPYRTCSGIQPDGERSPDERAARIVKNPY